MKTRLIAGAAVPAAILLATLAATLAACSTGAPVPAAGSTKPPVSATPEPAPADPNTPPTPVELWCTGPGYNNWSQVSSDLSRIHAAGTGGDLTAMSSDGSQLASDAAAAVNMPPPFDQKHTADFLFAMTSLRIAGANVVNGDLAAATRDMQTADGYINGVSPLITSDCLGG